MKTSIVLLSLVTMCISAMEQEDKIVPYNLKTQEDLITHYNAQLGIVKKKISKYTKKISSAEAKQETLRTSFWGEKWNRPAIATGLMWGSFWGALSGLNFWISNVALREKQVESFLCFGGIGALMGWFSYDTLKSYTYDRGMNDEFMQLPDIISTLKSKKENKIIAFKAIEKDLEQVILKPIGQDNQDR